MPDQKNSNTTEGHLTVQDTTRHNQTEKENAISRKSARKSTYYPLLSQYKFLRDDPSFQEYVRRNLWSARTERGYKSHTDVFEFIQTTYGNWLGKGIIQSDIRYLDKQLYNRLQKEISARRKLSMLPDWVDTQFPKERSDAAVDLLYDPELAGELKIVRKHGRDRKRALTSS